MLWRNGEHGYGVVSKFLHWLTVLAIAAQFAIGWTMDPGAEADRAEESAEAFEERGEERAERQGDAAEEAFEAEVERREEAADGEDDAASTPHVLVGLLVLLLGLARIGWRKAASLPPWAPHLSEGQRRLEGALEKALLSLLILTPASGLLLQLVSDDLLWLHITAQLALLATIAAHVGLVLWHTAVRRNRHLDRML